jgi:hypothetical protein
MQSFWDWDYPLFGSKLWNLKNEDHFEPLINNRWYREILST